MKERRQNFVIFTSLISLGPLWLAGIFFLYAGMVSYWARIHKGDDVAIGLLEPFCLFPITAILSIATIPLLIATIRRRYFVDSPKFVAFIPLIGAMFYVIINAIYFRQHRPHSYSTSNTAILMNVATSLHEALVSPFMRIYNTPSVIYDSTEKIIAIGEAVTNIFIPLTATILLGALWSFLLLFLLNSVCSKTDDKEP